MPNFIPKVTHTAGTTSFAQISHEMDDIKRSLLPLEKAIQLINCFVKLKHLMVRLGLSNLQRRRRRNTTVYEDNFLQLLKLETPVTEVTPIEGNKGCQLLDYLRYFKLVFPRIKLDDYV